MPDLVPLTQLLRERAQPTTDPREPTLLDAYQRDPEGAERVARALDRRALSGRGTAVDLPSDALPPLD